MGYFFKGSFNFRKVLDSQQSCKACAERPCTPTPSSPTGIFLRSYVLLPQLTKQGYFAINETENFIQISLIFPNIWPVFQGSIQDPHVACSHEASSLGLSWDLVTLTILRSAGPSVWVYLMFLSQRDRGDGFWKEDHGGKLWSLPKAVPSTWVGTDEADLGTRPEESLPGVATIKLHFFSVLII